MYQVPGGNGLTLFFRSYSRDVEGALENCCFIWKSIDYGRTLSGGHADEVRRAEHNAVCAPLHAANGDIDGERLEFLRRLLIWHSSVSFQLGISYSPSGRKST